MESGTITAEVEDSGTGEGGRWPLRRHALLLLVLLVALIPVIGTDSAFVTDESFVVIQLDTIEGTGGWTLPHPVPEVDPTGKAFPLHGAARYEDGYTLYGKHPALIYLYLPVHRAFGIVGLVALSVLGTWAAALTAALLANRIRAGTGTLALWLVGVGSPLFFDAYVIHAHSIAAALAGVAALLALRAIDERRAVLGLGAVLALLLVALLRTEGVLFAGALGGAIGLEGALRRRIVPILLGAAGIAAGLAALLVDRWWSVVVAGGSAVAQGSYSEPPTSFLHGRQTSATYTLLMPGYRGGNLAEMLTFMGAALLVIGAIVLRRRPKDPGAALLPVAGAALLVVRTGMEWGAVPGLLVAFCIGIVGLVLLGGDVSRSTTTRLLLVGSGVFVAAVAATQYPAGGHTEWGGRYFALAIPLLGAVAAASLGQALSTMAPRGATALRAALVAAAVALAFVAVTTVRLAHERNRARSDEVLAAAADLPRADGQPPIVITEDEQVPRLTRGRYGEARFLLVPSRAIHGYLDRLADEGVEDVLLVAGDPRRSLRRVPRSYEPVGPVIPHALQWDDGAGIIRLHLVDRS